MTVRCTDPAAYNRAVAAELDEAFRRVATGGTYVLGPELEAFETEFASYVGAPHCVGVGSGFDALVLGLRALGIGPGDEVLVPAHTFVATWLAVAAVGAVPVGVDVDDRTLLLDRTLLDAAVTPRTRAVVPVHLHGHPAAMAELTAWAARHGVLVLADAAQAHGARLDGRDIGAFGDASAWSFYPTKNLGCLGDGGAVTTSDPDVARQLRRIRDYGFERPGRSSTGGVNSRLDELQAALLRVKLRSLESCNDARRSQASRYLDGLGDLDALRLPMSPPDVVSVWHHFVIRCAPGVRERLRTDLADAGVETLVHYPEPPFAQPAFAALAIDPAVFPVTCRVVDEVVSLPIGLHLSDTDQTRVVEALHGALRAG